MRDQGSTHSMRESTSVTNADDTIARLHRNWVFGWELNVGDPPFSFREIFGDYYDWTFEGVILYDDFDTEHRVARSATEYGAIWDPNIQVARSIHHRIVDGPHVLRSDDLAASTLVFVARVQGTDGTVTGIRTTTSLVWRQTGEGWRIVREHNSTLVIPPDETGMAMDATTGH